MPAIRIDKCPKCGAVLRERTTEQNDLFHALLSDIAHQKQWAGQWLSVEEWKRLMIAAWERTKGQGPAMYPAIDGHGMDFIYTRSSRLAKQDFIDLIDYATAWAVEKDVHLHDKAA